MSQAMALKEHLEEAGHEVTVVFASVRPGSSLPDYFVHCFGEKIIPFKSPYFLRTPNRKGIYVGRSLLFNLLRSVSYIRDELVSRRKHTVLFATHNLEGAIALGGRVALLESGRLIYFDRPESADQLRKLMEPKTNRSDA